MSKTLKMAVLRLFGKNLIFEQKVLFFEKIDFFEIALKHDFSYRFLQIDIESASCV